ncbi:MAG: hypothetical protein Q8880_03890 [Bacteroidota bacterium]|nr:hypothetical protein [Bacteroidota bacterium]
MKNILTIIFFILITFLFSCNSCNSNKKFKAPKADISDVKVERVKICRYEEAIFKINPDNIFSEVKRMENKFPFFLKGGTKDSSNIFALRAYITDPNLIGLYKDCEKAYPDLKNIEEDLGKAFKYYKFYFPEKKIPVVYSYVSGIYFERPIIYEDSVIVIGLDMFLGAKYKYYKNNNIPLYMSKFFIKESIVPSTVYEMALREIKFKESNVLLDQMLYVGKLLYFSDLLMPDTDDSLKIRYTQNQLNWCKKNEYNVWSFMINQKALYSTDPGVNKKFMGDAPFTTYFSKQSPGRIASWIGWQIIRSYMMNNKNISIKELINDNNSQKILSLSKYKPEK